MKRRTHSSIFLPYDYRQTKLKKRKLGKNMSVAQDNGLGDNLTPYYNKALYGGLYDVAGPILSTTQGNMEISPAFQKVKGFKKFFAGLHGAVSELPGIGQVVGIMDQFTKYDDKYKENPIYANIENKGHVVGKGVTDIGMGIAQAMLGMPPTAASNPGDTVSAGNTGGVQSNTANYNQSYLPEFDTSSGSTYKLVKSGGMLYKKRKSLLGGFKPKYQLGGTNEIGDVKKTKGGEIKKIASNVVYADGQKHEGPNEGIDYDNIKIEHGELVMMLNNTEVVFSDTIPVPKDVVNDLPEELLPEKETKDMMEVNYNPSDYSFASVVYVVAKEKGTLEKKVYDLTENKKYSPTQTISLLTEEIDMYEDILESLYELQENIAQELNLRDENGYPRQDIEIPTQNMIEEKRKENTVDNFGQTLYQKSGREQKEQQEKEKEQQNRQEQAQQEADLVPGLSKREKNNYVENKTNNQNSNNTMYSNYGKYQMAGQTQGPQGNEMAQGPQGGQPDPYQVVQQFEAAFKQSGMKDPVEFLKTLDQQTQELVMWALQQIKAEQGQGQQSQGQQMPQQQMAAQYGSGRLYRRGGYGRYQAAGPMSEDQYAGEGYQDGSQDTGQDYMSVLQQVAEAAKAAGMSFEEYVQTLPEEQQQMVMSAVQQYQQEQGQEQQMTAAYGGKGKKLYRRRK